MLAGVSSGNDRFVHDGFILKARATCYMRLVNKQATALVRAKRIQEWQRDPEGCGFGFSSVTKVCFGVSKPARDRLKFAVS